MHATELEPTPSQNTTVADTTLTDVNNTYSTTAKANTDNNDVRVFGDDRGTLQAEFQSTGWRSRAFATTACQTRSAVAGMIEELVRGKPALIYLKLRGTHGATLSDRKGTKIVVNQMRIIEQQLETGGTAVIVSNARNHSLQREEVQHDPPATA